MRHPRRVVTLGVVCGALLASTATIAEGATAPRSTPGVTSKQVNLGAIVTQSGPLAADFKPYLDGVEAYFDYVNAAGGVYGRKLVMADALDDQSVPANNVNDAKTLVTVDKVFGIVGISTAFFSASKYLSTSGVPTFGYATANVWAGPKNFFADYGSELNYSSSIAQFGYVAKQSKATKVAVVALFYPSSKDECQGAVTGLPKFGFNVAYANVNEQLGQNWGVEASKIQHSGATLVVSCMDVNSNIALAKQMLGLGMHPHQLWLDGYDRSVLSANSAYMQNVYLMLQHVPFEDAATYPKIFPGVGLYLSSMAKYGFSSDEYSDVALMGWESANTFTMGLRAAGKSPTRAAVISAINRIKKDIGGPGGGVTAPVNWTIAHTKSTSPACETYVQVKNSSFAVALAHGTDPWTCYPLTGTINLSKPVPPPAGTPGG